MIQRSRTFQKENNKITIVHRPVNNWWSWLSTATLQSTFNNLSLLRGMPSLYSRTPHEYQIIMQKQKRYIVGAVKNENSSSKTHQCPTNTHCARVSEISVLIMIKEKSLLNGLVEESELCKAWHQKYVLPLKVSFFNLLGRRRDRERERGRER